MLVGSISRLPPEPASIFPPRPTCLPLTSIKPPLPVAPPAAETKASAPIASSSPAWVTILPPAPVPSPRAVTCPSMLMLSAAVTSTEPPLPFAAKASASTMPFRLTTAFITSEATLAEMITWPERACSVPLLSTPTALPALTIFSTAPAGTTKLIRPVPLRSSVKLLVPASAMVPRSALMKPVFCT